MNSEYFSRLKSALADERLSTYGRDKVPESTVVARYLWNMAICESLYGPLQLAEVALRNAVNHNLDPVVCGAVWWKMPEKTKLTSWQISEVVKAKRKLTKGSRPLTEGRVVAEMTFGFWTAFFDKPHASTGIGFHLVKHSFPHLDRSERNMLRIKAGWEDVRQLRNRVFHHERIIHWRDLESKHNRLLDLIGGISPSVRELAEVLDRFTGIRNQGIDPWLEKIQTHWPPTSR